MGSSTDPYAFASPQRRVSISAFWLDRYEVTVGRFRRFVRAYDSWTKPRPGDGALPGKPDTGWRSSWDDRLASSSVELRKQLECALPGQSPWTDEPARRETEPINCVTWYTAFAFCIWDGGRLASEAEWEYAAVGGSEQRTYPWGSTLSGGLPTPLVNFGNYLTTAPVGSAGMGVTRGKWGQEDLFGNVWEWTRDERIPYAAPQDTELQDPVAPFVGDASSETPVIRGFSWFPDDPRLFSLQYRSYYDPSSPVNTIGVRCARSDATVTVRDF
jgi:formylglycine-generating enzyme required for sulfatase activity